MKLNIVTTAVFALFAMVFTMLPEMALAQDGSGSVKAVTQALQSNYGLLIGLGVAALGMWMWLMDQNTWGVVMMIGGVAITAFPGLFAGLYEGAGSFFTTAGAGEGRAKAQVINDAAKE